MKPYIFRTSIVWTLIAAFIFSCIPANYAVAGGNPQQNSKTSGTKRGKNGTSTPAQANRQEDLPPLNGEVQPSSEKTQSATSQTQGSATSEEKKSAEEQKADSEKIPTTFEDAQPKQQGSRREPPPFDRPPASAQSPDNPSARPAPDFDRPASTGSGRPASSQPATRSDSQRPGVTVQTPSGNTSQRPSAPYERSQRYPSSDNDTDRYPANNTRTTGDSDPEPTYRSTPPVLKRERDSRNPNVNNGDSRGAPPVLRRSGESVPPPVNDRTNQQNSSQEGNRNPQQSGGAPPQQDNSQEETIKLDATLVNIPILVSDRSNRYISSLNVKDFLLYEDGVQQEVAFFGNEQVPFTVALLLDMSPSVQGNTEAIQDAAIDFVRQLRPDDRVMIISFDRRIDYLTDFTSDRRVMERAIRSVSTGSGTSVYDAVYETVARKLRNVDGRKALILFSDGEDTTSNKANYDEAINIVTESDVLVYGLRYASDNGGNVQVNPWPRSPIPNIGLPLPWPFPRRRGHFAPSYMTGQPTGSAAPQWPRRGGRGGRGGDFMSDVAEAGGGPVFDAQTVGDMRGLASKIADELRHVYQISYYPTNSLSNGGYRSIRIRVKNRDDISVRHRKGYNARDVANGNKI